MSNIRKLLESLDSLEEMPVVPKRTSDITITFTRKQALALDLVRCKCGHRVNNHFHFENHEPSTPCSHCDCKQYNEIVPVGKLQKPTMEF